jgi:2-polyprenyl-3-methyl-5-hydroxy-6-metoxy-1,4-benzoquinol methylase
MFRRYRPGKIRYILWALSQLPRADTSCPNCGDQRTSQVKRKALVTALYECEQCRLLFRVPKDAPDNNATFYQDQYTEGFTTELPSDERLLELMNSHFAGTEKDFSDYINVLRSLGVTPGKVMVDFGASWGYGSWQLREAGYTVYSHEIGKRRAEFAKQKLGCTLIEHFDEIAGSIDCFFSAHVIEHLPDPKYIWSVARKVLKPNGHVVLFMPNGNPVRRSKPGYHHLWGEVHPLLLTPESLRYMASQAGFSDTDYRSSPYGTKRYVDGDELMFTACRRTPERP